MNTVTLDLNNFIILCHTLQSGSNIEQELQAQAEKCLKHQQMIAGLKSELQLLRGGSGDQFNLQKQVP